MSHQLDHTFEEFDRDEFKQLYEDFGGYYRGAGRLMPRRFFVAKPFLKFISRYHDFKIRTSDVIVMAFPKTGSTWTQEIVWNLIHNPNLDNEKTKIPLLHRSPVIDGDYFRECLPKSAEPVLKAALDKFVKEHPNRSPVDGFNLHLCEVADDPRVFKSHLTFEFLPPSTLDTCKVVYICRDPKDVIVSYYKFSKFWLNISYQGELDSFVDYFLKDNVLISPFWVHVKQAWDLRKHPHLHFIYYEDLLSDPKSEIARLRDFLGLNLTDQQIDNVVEFTSFGAMKGRGNLSDVFTSDETTNKNMIEKEGGFFSKGTSGTWKDRLTEEQIKKIDDWSIKNMEPFDDEFKYKRNLLKRVKKESIV